eukprot:scaffold7207_cov520-Prasinococcus_capsulatus_cf.AAC.14
MGEGLLAADALARARSLIVRPVVSREPPGAQDRHPSLLGQPNRPGMQRHPFGAGGAAEIARRAPSALRSASAATAATQRRRRRRRLTRPPPMRQQQQQHQRRSAPHRHQGPSRRGLRSGLNFVDRGHPLTGTPRASRAGQGIDALHPRSPPAGGGVWLRCGPRRHSFVHVGYMKGLARQLSAHVLCTRSMSLPLSVRATWPLVLYEARLGTSSISDEMSHVFAGGS